MGLMRHLTGKKLDAAYEYLNWYYSGWQGAFVARYGYYSPVPKTAAKFMTPNEYGYWYWASRPSRRSRTLRRRHGKPGAKRDGGSFIERFTNISCWNTVMDENQYMIQALERVQIGLTTRANAGSRDGRRASTDGADLERSGMAAARTPACCRFCRWRSSCCCFRGAAIFFVVTVSFFHYDDFGIVPGFSFENYADVLTEQSDARRSTHR